MLTNLSCNSLKKWFALGGKYEYNGPVNDIISALTDKIVTNYGHYNGYWEIEENILSEIFADLSTLDVLDNEARDEKIFKKLFEAYKEIVNDI